MSQSKGTVPGHSDDAKLAGVLAGSLERLVPAWPDAGLCIALSGGVDSVALLHAARDLAAHDAAIRLRALHVDHGLQPASGEWAAFCRELCGRLAVPCEILELQLVPRKGESVEAEARRERYAALAAALQPGEQLLTAHHADDQLETVLLQLFRGAGVAGLAAMPEYAPLGSGYHLRPLLQVARVDLVAYAEAVGLHWIEDPMNREGRYDRSYLRHEVVPAIVARWPAAARTVGRSARHLAEAQTLLEGLAEADAAPFLNGEGTLEVAGLKALSRKRQVNVLRWWIAGHGLGAPSAARLGSILHDVVTAGDGAQPVVTWRGGEVRRYRGRLYAMKPLAEASDGAWILRVGGSVSIPGSGVVSLTEAAGEGISAARFPGPFQVRTRGGRGGSQEQDSGVARKIRRAIQSARIEPWLRERVPLIYSEQRLLAVGDRWLERGSMAAAGERSLTLRWLADR